MRCRRCRRPLVARGGPIPDGSATHTARGLCSADYASVRAAGGLESFPRVNTLDERRAAFLRAYRGMERLGWSSPEIADGLGISENLLRQRRSAYGLSKKQAGRTPKKPLEDGEVQRLRRLVGLR